MNNYSVDPWVAEYSELNWTTYTADPTMVYHQVQPMYPLPMSELHNVAQDSTVYYGMAAVSACVDD